MYNNFTTIIFKNTDLRFETPKKANAAAAVCWGGVGQGRTRRL